MTETIREYFTRFQGGAITESVYSKFTMADYESNKAVNEYLDYDLHSIFRPLGKPCGVRNIDNSCYFSVALQLLFNIQPLRQRVFAVASHRCNGFLAELQKLFAMLCKGRLVYADPSALFEVLKKLHPSLFVLGEQNDFHEVFTIILDELETSLPDEEDKKFIRKLFYGKTKEVINHAKGNDVLSSANDSAEAFNLINLSSEHRSLEAAVEQYRREPIQGYTNDKGDPVSAEREVHFTETPGILSLFINRVSYRDERLHKDCSEFEYEDRISFSKSILSRVAASSDSELEKMQVKLRGWIEDTRRSKGHLQASLSYFEAKEFPDVSLPSIENQLEERLKDNLRPYLSSEIQEMDVKIEQARQEVAEIERRRRRLTEETYSELYHIWAVMIHAGQDARSGHYKLCLRASDSKDEWVEFNDRRTEIVTAKQLRQYGANGQVCCLFYRRSSLACSPEAPAIPCSLKQLVRQEELGLFRKIDSARVLQALYQEFESASMVWEFESVALQQSQRVSTYFFKPALHLLLAGAPVQTCKAYVLYELISSPRFLEGLRHKLLSPDPKVQIPQIDFNIPKEYSQLSSALKEFCVLEVCSPVEAYHRVCCSMDTRVKDEVVARMLCRVREVILLKGIFYECLFIDHGLTSCYEGIRKSNARILQTLGQDDQCTLVTIPLRVQLSRRYFERSQEAGYEAIGTLKVDAKEMGRVREDYARHFGRRFQFWIRLAEDLLSIDESLLKHFQKLYPAYINKVPLN